MMRRVVAAALGTLLVGCACVPVDNLGALAPEVRALDECAGGAELAVGQACRFAVEAKPFATKLPVKTRPGERYRLDVPSNQRWTDWTRPSDPTVGDPGNGLMNLLKGRRRLPAEDWFRLGVAWRQCPTGSEDCAETLGRAVGTGTTVDILESKELILFANDLPGFYGNNCGCIWVRLERLAPDL